MPDRLSHETGRKAIEMQAKHHQPGKLPRIIAIGEIAYSPIYNMADGLRERTRLFILEQWDAQHGMWISARSQPITLAGAQQYTKRWPQRYQIVSAKFTAPDTDKHKLECLTVGQHKLYKR